MDCLRDYLELTLVTGDRDHKEPRLSSRLPGTELEICDCREPRLSSQLPGAEAEFATTES